MLRKYVPQRNVVLIHLILFTISNGQYDLSLIRRMQKIMVRRSEVFYMLFTEINDDDFFASSGFYPKVYIFKVVKQRAIDLDCLLMVEYKFRNNKINPDVPEILKPRTRIRRYQERLLINRTYVKVNVKN